MQSATARQTAEEINRDLRGAAYYKDAGVLATFLQSRFGSSSEKAAEVAAAVLDDLSGAAYYNNVDVLADYLDAQFIER
jgi:hypothetical protein